MDARICWVCEFPRRRKLGHEKIWSLVILRAHIFLLLFNGVRIFFFNQVEGFLMEKSLVWKAVGEVNIGNRGALRDTLLCILGQYNECEAL